MIRFSFCSAAVLAIVSCAPFEAPVKSLALLDGAVNANAPAGYCVDPAASQPADGFALIASCASLGADDKAPDALGVATVQVGPATSGAVIGSEDALVGLLNSEAGAVLLSKDGKPDQIKVIAAETGENAVTVQFTDAGAPPIAGLGAEEWRAFTDIDGRLVTVAVRGLATAPLRDGTGAWLLDLVLNGLLPSTTGETAETSDT
ncbi:dihydroxy-acid dehydratase [Yoonia sp. SS1-5]|uniref:Dihydroxy-acid dehydratase n=1 Tax=Yoonia rhodophyticola TaxID=3137370 RepID=A0AAN0MCM9_9RHOB